MKTLVLYADVLQIRNWAQILHVAANSAPQAIADIEYRDACKLDDLSIKALERADAAAEAVTSEKYKLAVAEAAASRKHFKEAKKVWSPWRIGLERLKKRI